jgi:hypothetical protein
LVGLRVKYALFPMSSNVGWKATMSVSDASTITGAWSPFAGSARQSPKNP